MFVRVKRRKGLLKTESLKDYDHNPQDEEAHCVTCLRRNENSFELAFRHFKKIFS